MIRVYIISKDYDEMNYDEDDYKYFFDQDDMLKFLNKNEEYKIRDDLPSTMWTIYELLTEAYKLSSKISNYDKIEFMNGHLNKYMCFKSFRDHTKLGFGLVKGIYFENFLSEDDYALNSVIGNSITVGDIQFGGMFDLIFSNYSDSNMLNDITDHSIANNKKRKKKSFTSSEEVNKEVIYFIQDSNSKSIKIGVTRNVENRIKQLKTANPYEIVLLKTISGGYEKEKTLHEQFSKYRLSGEWFAENDELLKYIEKSN